MAAHIPTSFTIGVVGLGLIGGSLARTARKRTPHQVLGLDTNLTVLETALEEKVIHGSLLPETMKYCRVLFIALYPQATVKWLTQYAVCLGQETIVVDCCGVKEAVCGPCQTLAETYGFTYIGGHPMAGAHQIGFASSQVTLFDQASMILTPSSDISSTVLEELEALFLQLGFGQIIYTTSQNHDRMIAYTSQLAHILSNAYVKSPQALHHKGYSAGSFRDLTRVAWLNEEMWTQLFMDNRTFLIQEIDDLVQRLLEYSQALRDGNEEQLKTLLREGRQYKEEVDTL